jgi:hypothetical protein
LLSLPSDESLGYFLSPCGPGQRLELTAEKFLPHFLSPSPGNASEPVKGQALHQTNKPKKEKEKT